MPRLRELWFDLPPQLEDVTEYFFTSDEGPLLVLPLIPLTLPSDQQDAWLLAARDKMKVFPGVGLGPLTTYENPRYRVRGFEANFGSSLVVTVLVGLEHGFLRMTTKCRPGYQPYLERVLNSLRRDDGSGPTSSKHPSYAAAGFRFESAQHLNEPRTLMLRSKDEKICIAGRVSAKRPKNQRPEWNTAFGLGPGEVTTEVLQGRWLIMGQSTPERVDPITFHSEHWLAIVHAGEVQGELCWAQATTRGDVDYFRFELKSTGRGGLEHLDVWAALLASARVVRYGS
jgi:hypothetical protein